MAIKIASQDIHADGTLVLPNKLGIGTSGPASTLHLAKSGGAVLRVTTDAGAGGASSSILMGNQDSYGTNKPLVIRSFNTDLYIGTGDSWSSETGGTLTSRMTLTLGKLEVDGNIILKGAAGGNSWTNQRLLFGGDGTGYTCSIGSINNLGTINTPVMTLQDNGRVGIGTSSPEDLLHVKGTAQWVQPIIDSSSSSTGGSALLLRANQNTWQLASRSSANGFINNGFSIYESLNNAIRFVIAAGGNVGIGTSSPGTTLHATAPGFSIAYFTNGTFTSSSNSTLYIGGGDAGLGGWENTFLGLYKYGSTAGVGSSTNLSRIRFDASTTHITTDAGGYVMSVGANGTYSGRVGIGTSSPSTGLHVSTSDGSITANNTGGTDSSLFLHTTGTLKWSITQAPLAGDRLYIRDAQTNDGVYMSQNTTSWTANSDSRLKDVQGTIANALDKVQQLTGVKFTWKRDANNPDAKVRVGLIAQDVQAVLPEAVDDESPDLITDEETGRVSGGLGVRYTELVPLLVNAIKELTARVAVLEQA